MAIRTRTSGRDGPKTRHAASSVGSYTKAGNGAVESLVDSGGKGKGKNSEEVSKAVALSLVDYTLMLSLVFGGCCSLVHTVIYYYVSNTS